VTPEEVELLSQLTIVIPTYNRPLALERSIEYWRDTPVTVHILDGSFKPCFSAGERPGILKIFYYHMPPKQNQNRMENLYERIVFGSSLSKTKFSAFACDDDFYTISGLISSLKILESQKNIDAVSGLILTYFRNRKMLWYHKYVPRIGRTDLETESVREKLATGSSWFLYAVCRTEIWQKFFVTCYEEKGFTEANIFAHEWMSYLLCKAMFRTKCIDIIQLVRQDTVIGANVPPDIPWEQFICDKQNAETIDAIVGQLAKGFNEVTPLSEHSKNLELAREQMRLEQLKASTSRTASQKSKTLKSVLGNILFFFLPGLDIFSDRPRRLKYLWRTPKYQYSAEQQREVEEIEKLLLMPREELRLRANI